MYVKSLKSIHFENSLLCKDSYAASVHFEAFNCSQIGASLWYFSVSVRLFWVISFLYQWREVSVANQVIFSLIELHELSFIWASSNIHLRCYTTDVLTLLIMPSCANARRLTFGEFYDFLCCPALRDFYNFVLVNYVMVVNKVDLFI